MKNPKWERDEIILALDLYFDLPPGEMHNKNEKVISLSDLLNRLPIHQGRDLNDKFRNANGVGLKLANFTAIDPLKGKGMNSYSKLDKLIFTEFVDDKNQLKIIANRIRKISEDASLMLELNSIDDNYDAEVVKIKEGKVLYKLHRFRERNSSIIRRKKEIALKRNNCLKCEVCEFDFFKVYGELGLGFAECHHIIPLNIYSSEMETRMSDLAIVCSNCHRMLHRMQNEMSISGLKSLLKDKI